MIRVWIWKSDPSSSEFLDFGVWIQVQGLNRAILAVINMFNIEVSKEINMFIIDLSP